MEIRKDIKTTDIPIQVTCELMSAMDVDTSGCWGGWDDVELATWADCDCSCGVDRIVAPGGADRNIGVITEELFGAPAASCTVLLELFAFKNRT